MRIYLPPDANCLLSVADHCLRSRNYINLIIAGKQPEWQWLDIDSAVRHCTAGAGIWQWASNDAGDPDVVMACAGDVPTLETLAAVTLLREYVPDIRIRVVNVVDLMVLQPQSEHPHGLEDQDFDELFTRDKPVIFAFHGYPAMIHKLTYRRHNHDNIHVRGYKEEGTTTTPFDMVVLNNLDRYQLALDAIRRIPRLGDQVEKATARYWTIDGASQALYQRARRRHAGGPRLALELVSDVYPMQHDRAGIALPILALNSGSSSLKFGIVPRRTLTDRSAALRRGRVDRRAREANFDARDFARKCVLSETLPFPANGKRSSASAKLLADSEMPAPAAIGHRIVHGGPKLRQHCLIDDDGLAAT